MAKLCKNCRHARPDIGLRLPALAPVIGWLMAPWLWRSSWEYARCANPGLPLNANRDSVDLVTGRVHYRSQSYCSTARKFDDECGVDARLFEPKRGSAA